MQVTDGRLWPALCGLMIAVLLSSPLIAATNSTDIISKSRHYLVHDQPEKAYALLLQHEMTYAGQVTFDYWLGVAAVRSSEPSYALLALDRVLMRAPKHAGARMERAIALLQLGMLQQSDAAFAELQQQNPPPAAARTIRHYRDLIAERKTHRNSAQHTAIVGVSAGYDSNVNTAPSDYLLQFFGGLFQAEVDAVDSAFIEQQGAYSGYVPLADKEHLQLQLVAQARQYQKTAATGFDLAFTQAGINWHKRLPTDMTVTAGGDIARLFAGDDYSAMLWQYSLNSGLTRPVFNDSLWLLNGQWRHLAYDDQSNNDFQAIKLETALKTPLTARWQSKVSASAERELAKGQRDGADAWRFRINTSAQYQWNEQHQVALGLQYQQLNYDTKGFAVYSDLTARERTDRTWQSSLTWRWQPSEHWMINSTYRYRQQESDIDYFDYDQQTFNAGINYLWR